MYKYGLLDDNQNKLDYVLALTPQDFLERRLQTLVFKLGLAKSIHHARVLIRQRHIRSTYLSAPSATAAHCMTYTPRDSMTGLKSALLHPHEYHSWCMQRQA